MSITRAILLSLTAVGAINAQYTASCTNDSQLQDCGNQRYCPDNYTCYNGNELCPVQDGVEYKACYNGVTYACYNPYVYG